MAKIFNRSRRWTTGWVITLLYIGGGCGTDADTANRGVVKNALSTRRSETAALIHYPKGVYALWPSDTPMSQGFIDNRGLRGVVLQAKWVDVEPSDGVYVFDDIEARLAEAKRAGLAVVLGINGALKLIPDWVQATETISFLNLNTHQPDYCTEIPSPVFWDSEFLAQRVEIIKAMGKAFRNNPRIVAVETNFANALTDDWNVPHARNGTCTKDGVVFSEDQTQKWLDAGYTHEKMLTAGKTILSAVAEAFPRHKIKLPLGTTNDALDGQEYALAADIAAWADQALPERVHVEVHNLNGKRPNFESLPENPTNLDAVYRQVGQASPNSGLQMVSSATYVCQDGCRLLGGNCPDPCVPAEILRDVMAIGLTHQPSYIELWRGDGQNPDLYGVIAEATAILSGEPMCFSKHTSGVSWRGWRGKSYHRCHAQTTTPPSFLSDPFQLSDATTDLAYVDSIASQASDPDNYFMTFSKIGGPAWLAVGTNGAVSGTPSATDEGLNEFVVRVDTLDGSDQATLQIIVAPYTGPSWASDSFTKVDAVADAVYTQFIQGKATDPDGDKMTFSKVSGPAWLEVLPGGKITGTPSAADVGLNEWVVRVETIDGSDDAVLRIVVAPATTGPTWASDLFTKANAVVDTVYTQFIQGKATDADGDKMTFSKVSGPAWLEVLPGGKITGTPRADDVGLNEWVVRVETIDGSDDAVLQIVVLQP